MVVVQVVVVAVVVAILTEGSSQDALRRPTTWLAHILCKLLTRKYGRHPNLLTDLVSCYFLSIAISLLSSLATIHTSL